MLKLYRISQTEKDYWETWEHDGVHTVHWGRLGTRGESKTLKDSLLRKAHITIQKEIDQKVGDGFSPIDPEHHRILLIEFTVDGMGTVADIEKRHRLQARMDETLGWTGLGHCDGGSIGSGTMEVCCLVVDFPTAKIVVENDLKGTEFSDYTRIYDENE